METIKFMFEVFVAFILCAVSLTIALIPVIVYQVNGGTDPTIDILLRCFGFFIWLAMFMYYMHLEG
ncbi:hypothetical protein [Escherichia coli]|uniref:hypothetical protein n=1 Tax=Escherichia coli TaxID=562 RepID=UPI001697CC01|nr:hypothetical protein [Escherichia coli]MED6573131.1 hypothetical protein [Escherichia coli O157]MED6826594.1 hypothetical protein [Escherichia coli O157]